MLNFLRPSVNTKSPVNRLKEVKQFTTGKGIHLGISKPQLVSILGKPTQKHSKNDIESFEYRIGVESYEKLNQSKFLEYYNMPTYYGNYKFKGDRLIAFQFGFLYP